MIFGGEVRNLKVKKKYWLIYPHPSWFNAWLLQIVWTFHLDSMPGCCGLCISLSILIQWLCVADCVLACLSWFNDWVLQIVWTFHLDSMPGYCGLCTRISILLACFQHAMLLPVLIGHLRFHRCLEVLQDMINYQFKDRMLLQLALTHPSYRVNFGTNSDHARNSLSNCGIRQPEYGDRRIHHVHTRKRG